MITCWSKQLKRLTGSAAPDARIRSLLSNTDKNKAHQGYCNSLRVENVCSKSFFFFCGCAKKDTFPLLHIHESCLRLAVKWMCFLSYRRLLGDIVAYCRDSSQSVHSLTRNEEFPSRCCLLLLLLLLLVIDADRNSFIFRCLCSLWVLSARHIRSQAPGLTVERVCVESPAPHSSYRRNSILSHTLLYKLQTAAPTLTQTSHAQNKSERGEVANNLWNRAHRLRPRRRLSVTFTVLVSPRRDVDTSPCCGNFFFFF